MSADTYNTITKTSEGLFKNKGSKFLAFAFPADNESVVKEHIKVLKKKYHDALLRMKKELQDLRGLLSE